MNRLCAVAGLALALGCGSKDKTSTQEPTPPTQATIPVDPVSTTQDAGAPVSPPPVTPEAPPCNGMVTLRLAGVNSAPGTGETLDFGGVQVTRGGAPVPTTFVATGTATFPVTGAYRMAVVPLDRAGGPVDVTYVPVGARACSFDPTGTFGRCHGLDTCFGGIQFRYDPTKVRTDNCHVVVSIDLSTSFLRVPAGMSFVPQYRVEY